MIPLRNAMKIFGGREKPWGPVMRAIRDGTLPCVVTQPEINSNALLVRVSDMRALQHLQFDRNRYSFPFSSTISQRDAEELLNITAPTFQEHHLKAALEFEKSGKGAYAAIAKVLSLSEAVITRTELALRRGIPPHAITNDPRLEGIQRLSFGWDRNQLKSRCQIQ
jgi:hypothetical protein